MIAYIVGKVILKSAAFIVIDIGGIGYRVFVCPGYDYALGDKVVFFVHHHFRENSQELYGFGTQAELNFFEKLITVNGIGPKLALAILAQSNIDMIIDSIRKSDVSYFTSISGVGKKMAAKIILELKQKVENDEIRGLVESQPDAEIVLDALISLGYKKEELAKVMMMIPPGEKAVEAKIHWCLKNLAK